MLRGRVYDSLTLTLLTWRIWWAPGNASKWQIGFNSAFKGLNVAGDSKTYAGLHTKCQILTRFVFSRKILIKVPSIQFYRNSSSGGAALIHGQTDSLTVGHDEGIKRFSQLCERAWKAQSRICNKDAHLNLVCSVIMSLQKLKSSIFKDTKFQTLT